MTPKEKAEELIEKFDGYTHYAIYAVDEILDLIDTIYDYDREELDPYWKQVKQEIEKL
jgi:hypothetical protein